MSRYIRHVSRQQAGFTLLELLVVIVSVAILIALVLIFHN